MKCPIVAPLFLTTIFCCNAAFADPAALRLVDRHLEACGGRSALQRMTSITRAGRIEVHSGGTVQSFGYRTDLVYPSKLREKIEGHGLVLVDRGTDGRFYWQRQGNIVQELTNDHDRAYLRLTAQRANRDLLWLTEEYDSLESSAVSPSWASKDECLVAKKAQEASWLCFDRATGLLSAKGKDSDYRLFGQWVEVEGIKIPFMLSQYTGGQRVYEIHLESVRSGHAIDPSRFLP